MTDLDTVKLREMLEAATPGKWYASDVRMNTSPSKIDGFAFPVRRASHVAQVAADTALLVALVNAAPELIAAAEAAALVADIRSDLQIEIENAEPDKPNAYREGVRDGLAEALAILDHHKAKGGA